MIPHKGRAAVLWRPTLVLAAGLLACHPGLAPPPWSGAGARTPAAHAEVATLNSNYQRTHSGVLVRRIDRPTRAALDYAAYHANFMIADPPPETGPVRGGVVDTTNPFQGLVAKSTLTGDIGKTPLTDAERAHPLAFAPAVEFLAASKVAGADALEEVGAAVRGESWGPARGPQVATQSIAELYLHGGELWVKIEFVPWFQAFQDLPDQDGDGFPEVYGRVRPDHAPAPALEALRGDYSTRVLSPAEIKGWANHLSSYWYPSFNTDLIAAGPTWPDQHTEADIKAELGGQVFPAPAIVLRGKPQGKPTYEVFLINTGAAPTVAQAGAAGGGGPKLPPTRPTPQPQPTADAIRRELATQGGGSWTKWTAAVAPLHDAIRQRLHAMPPKVKAMAGADGFLFFRNSLEFVVGGDLERQPKGKNPLPIILAFQKELAVHGVDFLFVPVPTKVEIFPDELAPAQKALVGKVVNPFERKFVLDLTAAGVEVFDLLPSFLAARSRGEAAGEEPLYQHQDTHWTDRGLRLAAAALATRIKSYPWYPQLAAHARRYATKPATFTRFGDLHSRLPDAQRAGYKPETLAAQQVLGPDGALYDDDPDSPIVILGDSFTGVYELTDAEHAGVSAHIAKAIGYPVDLVMSYGGGPNVRQKLMRRGVDALATKKLVVWMMTARDLYNYWEDWEPLKVK